VLETVVFCGFKRDDSVCKDASSIQPDIDIAIERQMCRDSKGSEAQIKCGST
jgi:hypothetical protein